MGRAADGGGRHDWDGADGDADGAARAGWGPRDARAAGIGRLRTRRLDGRALQRQRRGGHPRGLDRRGSMDRQTAEPTGFRAGIAGQWRRGTTVWQFALDGQWAERSAQALQLRMGDGGGRGWFGHAWGGTPLPASARP